MEFLLNLRHLLYHFHRHISRTLLQIPSIPYHRKLLLPKSPSPNRALYSRLLQRRTRHIGPLVALVHRRSSLQDILRSRRDEGVEQIGLAPVISLQSNGQGCYRPCFQLEDVFADKVGIERGEVDEVGMEFGVCVTEESSFLPWIIRFSLSF